MSQTTELRSFNPPQEGVLIRLWTPGNVAAWALWYLSGLTSPPPQQAAAYGLEQVLGPAALPLTPCTTANIGGPVPEAFLAVENMAAIGVGWGRLATAGNPAGYAMAAPPAQFAALTR